MASDWNRTYISFAELIAQHSKAEKEKVGCVIVKDGQVISTGYNGTPPGYDNQCEDVDEASGKLITRQEVIHAEINAISKVASSTINSAESTLYVTKPPCYECAKAIIMSGIRVVIFKGKMADAAGSVKFLNNNGVITIPINMEGNYTDEPL